MSHGPTRPVIGPLCRHGVQASPTPSPSMSPWSAFASTGQLSHTSPKRSESASSCSGSALDWATIARVPSQGVAVIVVCSPGMGVVLVDGELSLSPSAPQAIGSTTVGQALLLRSRYPGCQLGWDVGCPYASCPLQWSLFSS